MLKNLLLSAFLLAFLAPVSAQHKRRVLIEEFTNAGCTICAARDTVFNATIDSNWQYLTPIKYHIGWPGYDPMYVQTQSEVESRQTYYSQNYIPTAFQNGILELDIPLGLTTYDSAMIQAAYNTLTPVTMDLSHELTANLDSVIVHVAVKSDSDLSGNFRLRVAVIEKEIVFEDPPGDDYPPPSGFGGTGLKVFEEVMRKMLPNSDGTSTGNFTTGETKSYDITWPLANIYNLNEIAVVGWLQNDATKEVYQSALSEPVGGIPPVGVKVPSMIAFTCTASDIPYFYITNTADVPLSSAQLRYKVGNGATKDFNWTGNLAPGKTERVDLVGETVLPSGFTDIKVEVVASNNGFQTNLVAAISTIRFKALLATPLPPPVSNDFQGLIFPPIGWTGYFTYTFGWKLANGFGAGGSTRSAFCDFWNIRPRNTLMLITPKIDLSQGGGAPVLKFDRAYAYADDVHFDSLRIEVSTDCGQNWATVYHDGKDGLSTAEPKPNGDYFPAAGEWASNEIDLAAFNGNPEVLVRFVGESGYGNNLYVDNVNVSLVSGVKELPLSAFTLQPNPANEYAQVRFSLLHPSQIRMLVFNATGALVQSRELGTLVAGAHVAELDATRFAPGNYRVVLQGEEGVAQTLWVVIR